MEGKQFVILLDYFSNHCQALLDIATIATTTTSGNSDQEPGHSTSQISAVYSFIMFRNFFIVVDCRAAEFISFRLLNTMQSIL